MSSQSFFKTALQGKDENDPFIKGVKLTYDSYLEVQKNSGKIKGFNPYEIVKGVQPICFENAGWAYCVGAAIAIKKGVNRVHILDGRLAHCLLLEIFTNKGIGTMFFGDDEKEKLL